MTQPDPEPLHQRAYDRLKRALMTGVYKPGQRITIRASATALGMSMTPVREALRRLVAEGALETLPNQSVRIPAPSIGRLRQLARARMVLEGLAAEIASASDQRGALADHLEQIQMELAAARDRRDFPFYVATNERFHFALYRGAEDPVLLQLIESLWLQAGPLLTELQPSMRGIDLHAIAIDAVRNGNGEAARTAVAEDIRRVAELLESFVSEGLASQPVP
jgi:DNA-binding GntR family transcriptional regulator